MNEALLRFLHVARGAGLRISPAESIDAARALEVVGYDDRGRLKDTLSLVLAKSVEEKERFAECFELYFSRDAFRDRAPDGEGEDAAGGDEGEGPPGQGAPGGSRGEGMGGGGGNASALGRMLLENDQPGLATAMEQAAEAVGLTGISVFTQVNLFTYRILQRMGLRGLEEEIAALRRDGGPEAMARAQRLQHGRDWLRGEVRDVVQRNLLMFARGETEAYREEMLMQARLAGLDRRDQERMKVLVRSLARQLATQYGRNRRRKLRGQLDARRTIRRNMGWDGVPFLTVWKTKKIDRPKVMVLCDVSGSVASIAQFLLLFLHSLNEALSSLRAFAFSGALIEVTEILDREPIDSAITTIMARIGYGSSNYGNSLVDFAKGWMSKLDSQTTVLILGDARGNRTEPQVDILRQISERSRRIIWLNPEMRTVWGTGDSDMLRYLPYCHTAATCSTLHDLDKVISELLRNGG